MNHTPPHLAPALVPGPLQGRSVYNELRRTKRRKQWEALRGSVLETAANTCTHCKAIYESRMVCHEVWAYDDVNHIATLAAFEIVCRDCDSVLHYGKTLLIDRKKGGDGMDTPLADQAVAHLMKVNGITKRKAHKLIMDAFDQWLARSEQAWTVQIAPELIDKYLVLTGLEL